MLSNFLYRYLLDLGKHHQVKINIILTIFDFFHFFLIIYYFQFLITIWLPSELRYPDDYAIF